MKRKQIRAKLHNQNNNKYYCITCPNEITKPSERNDFDLWCHECVAKTAHVARKETSFERHKRLSIKFQQRVFRDCRGGKKLHF